MTGGLLGKMNGLFKAKVFDGDFSIRSGAIGNNQTSEISVEYNV